MSLQRKPSKVIRAVLAGATTGAYTNVQQIGVPVELKNAVLDSGGSGTIVSVAIQDPAKQDAAVDLLFFSQQPAATTDKSTIGVSAADLANLLGVIKIAATTPYSDLGTPSIGVVTSTLKIKATKSTANQSNTSIWLVPVSRGTPNYGASAATLALEIGIDQD